MKEQADMRLAVLIDADNIPYSNIKGMLDEIAKFGNPTIKRIYGDWTKPTVSGWKQPLLEHAITPIQQYSYTTGKNATDGFCLVSSDSDFTRLAVRLRESGMLVLGMGERKTPNPFIVACDKFIYIEILEDDIAQQDPVSSEVPVNKKSNVEPVSKALLNLLKSTVRDLADDDGWAYLGEVGNLIIKKRPDFDPRNYGFPKLTPMIKAQKKIFEIDQRDVDNKKHAKLIYVRVKDS